MWNSIGNYHCRYQTKCSPSLSKLSGAYFFLSPKYPQQSRSTLHPKVNSTMIWWKVMPTSSGGKCKNRVIMLTIFTIKITRSSFKTLAKWTTTQAHTHAHPHPNHGVKWRQTDREQHQNCCHHTKALIEPEQLHLIFLSPPGFHPRTHLHTIMKPNQQGGGSHNHNPRKTFASEAGT